MKERKEGRGVKRTYTSQEMERILRQDLRIPEEVEQKIQGAYRTLGVETEGSIHFGKGRKIWKALAAVAVLTVGSSLVVFAANKLLSADLVKEEDAVVYDLTIDRTQEAHKIEVKPTYMPEGYTLGDENSPYGGKWHNEETGGGISILAFHAAELDEMNRLGETKGLTRQMKPENLQKEIEINGMKLALFVSENAFVDSDKKRMDVQLFNEEQGYLVEIINMDSTLSQEELIKIAEGLQIDVSEESVPYKTEEEIAKTIAEREAEAAKAKDSMQSSLVKENCFFSTGEELKTPYLDPQDGKIWDDVRYTVESIEIKDKLPLSEYPAENYPAYAQEVKDWVLEDGALKPHERYRYTVDSYGNTTGEEPVLETVNSKYIVVKMKVKNCNKENPYPDNYEVYVAPTLEHLDVQADGVFHNPVNDKGYRAANEGYRLQYGDGFPIYFDQAAYTEGIEGMKHAYFVPLDPGEELEYTLVYVVDEDQIEDAYLYFYGEYNGFDNGWEVEEGKNDFVYVKVKQETK